MARITIEMTDAAKENLDTLKSSLKLNKWQIISALVENAKPSDLALKNAEYLSNMKKISEKRVRDRLKDKIKGLSPEQIEKILDSED